MDGTCCFRTGMSKLRLIKVPAAGLPFGAAPANEVFRGQASFRSVASDVTDHVCVMPGITDEHLCVTDSLNRHAPVAFRLI